MVGQTVIIVGAGGHGIVLADALLAAGTEVRGFTDWDVAMHAMTVLGIPVVGDDAVLGAPGQLAAALANGLGAVGAPGQLPHRQAVQEALEERGWLFINVLHPRAIISRFAEMGEGTQILAGAIIQPRAKLGAGVIVNTGALIEHDVQLGVWTHVAPGATVCGNVRIGARCHVGAGAVVKQGVLIGDDVVIGAGAVVVRDFAGPGTLTGVPARPAGVSV